MRNGSGYIDPTMSAALKDYKKPVVKKQLPKKKAEKKPLVYNATPAWTAPEKKCRTTNI